MKTTIEAATGPAEPSAEHEPTRETMERANAMLRAQQEATPDAILIVDLSGRVLSYNSKFLNLWGIPLALAATHDDDALLSFVMRRLKDPTSFLDTVRRLYAEPLEVRQDETIEFVDGRIIARSTLPVVMSDGHPVARAWYFRDVTVQKRLESDLRHSQKMEALGTLAGGIAHDFNNLLTAIGGFIEIARQGLPPRGPESDALRTAAEAVSRATDLTKGLLNFGRRSVATFQLVDLRVALDEAARFLAPSLATNITIERVVAPGLWMTRADPGQIQQVITNLCLNARDAMPSGGRLTVELGNRTLKAGATGPRAEARAGEYVVLKVTDTGAGIPPEVVGRIFDPFYTTKEVGKGTGLGLAIVHGIVDLHGGWIECESESGRGATFAMFFPRAVEKIETRKREPFQGARGAGETILIADDEEMIRSLVKGVLEACGYRVIAAADGAEAIEIFEARGAEIDLVILDLVMPRRTGSEAFAEIHASRPETPIVISSGYSAEGQIEELLRLGARASVPKPFNVKDLAGTVRELLAAKAAAAGSSSSG